MINLIISQIKHPIKLDLKYHLVKLVSGLVNKATQFNQFDKCPSQ
jgi:hypothetical protein